MRSQLGLGLIGIGRPWPTDDAPVASQQQADDILQAACDLGLALVDTAPAYGSSEARLGAYLGDRARRAAPFKVATKCGEFWTAERGSWADHSPAAIEKSVRASADLLGRIDLLQIHKATPEIVRNRALTVLLCHLASELGIAHLGVSARDVSTCEAALASGAFDHVQCPVNPGVPELSAWAARNCGDITIIANRPYGSGALLAEGWTHRDLLRYSADHVGPGIVLTGTTSPDHLRQTHATFPVARTGSGR
jgi:aryl-alcohol dehydrogenase-like predicted oxidoreductase